MAKIHLIVLKLWWESPFAFIGSLGSRYEQEVQNMLWIMLVDSYRMYMHIGSFINAVVRIYVMQGAQRGVRCRG